MGDLFGGSTQTSTSYPVNFTPSAYKNLAPTVANALTQLILGGGPAPTTGDIFANMPNTVTRTTTPATTTPAPTPTPAPNNGPFNFPGSTGMQFPWSGGAGRNRNVPLRNGGTPGGGGQGTGQQTGSTGTTPPASTTTTVAPNPNYVPPTNSSLVAPLDQNQLNLINQIVSSVSTTPGANPLMDAVRAELTKTVQGNYLSPDSNPFLKSAVDAALYQNQRNFTGTVVPQLLSRFTGNGQEVQGQGSSAFANAADLAAKDFENTQAATSSGMYLQNYQGERQNQIDATAKASQLSTDELNNMTKALQAASLPQLVNDLGIQRGLEVYNQRLQTVLDALKIAAGASQPTVATAGSSSGSSSNGILGGLAAGFSALFPKGI